MNTETILQQKLFYCLDDVQLMMYEEMDDVVVHWWYVASVCEVAEVLTLPGQHCRAGVHR